MLLTYSGAFWARLDSLFFLFFSFLGIRWVVFMLFFIVFGENGSVIHSVNFWKGLVDWFKINYTVCVNMSPSAVVQLNNLCIFVNRIILLLLLVFLVGWLATRNTQLCQTHTLYIKKKTVNLKKTVQTNSLCAEFILKKKIQTVPQVQWQLAISI